MTDEQRRGRIHDIVYSCDSRSELAERIVKLEELVADYTNVPCRCSYCIYVDGGNCSLCARAFELGIEV